MDSLSKRKKPEAEKTLKKRADSPPSAARIVGRRLTSRARLLGNSITKHLRRKRREDSYADNGAAPQRLDVPRRSLNKTPMNCHSVAVVVQWEGRLSCRQRSLALQLRVRASLRRKGKHTQRRPDNLKYFSYSYKRRCVCVLAGARPHGFHTNSLHFLPAPNGSRYWLAGGTR